MFDLTNVVENDGMAICVTGLSIVFSALAAVTLFIALLPRMLEQLKDILPAEAHPHHPHPPAAPRETEEALVVAIGYALARRGGKPPGNA